MANEKTQVEIDAAVDAAIKVNGNREITPPLHNAIEKMLSNSNLNKKDGGTLQARAFYSSAFSLTDPLTLVYKSYVDDLITTLDALTQGTNTLTEDLNIYADGFTITILSGLNASESPRAKIIVVPAGAAIAYEDVGDPSQNSSFSATQRFAVVQGILQMNEAVELQSNAIYWKGNKDSPSEGDIREYYNEGTDEIITEKYTSGNWEFRGSR